MKPSIGRIVLFGVDQSQRGNNNGGAVAPAIITHVFSDTCVNLKVLTDGPVDLWHTSVLIDDDPAAAVPAPSRWIWPPRV